MHRVVHVASFVLCVAWVCGLFHRACCKLHCCIASVAHCPVASCSCCILSLHRAVRQATDAALVVIAHVDATVWLVALRSHVATSVCVAYIVHVCRRCCRSSPPISKYTRAAERCKPSRPAHAQDAHIPTAHLPRSRRRHGPYRPVPAARSVCATYPDRFGVRGQTALSVCFFCFLRPAGRCVRPSKGFGECSGCTGSRTSSTRRATRSSAL